MHKGYRHTTTSWREDPRTDYHQFMPSCCRAAPCEELFDERFARWTLRAYRKRGLGRLERQMLDAVPNAELQGARVLEIGGGIGALQATLLTRGANTGENVELIHAYEPYARELAEHLGVTDQTTFQVADLIQDPAATEPADHVLLDKVICCTVDGLELVTVAATLTRGTLVLSFPRYNLLSRLAQHAQATVFRWFGRQYRFYVRPAKTIEAAANTAGLTKVASGGGPIWQYLAFRATPERSEDTSCRKPATARHH